MFAELTVFETLMVSAHFQLPKSMSDESKREYVLQIIAELGLNKAKDTMIGDERRRGVSGGERKRCNIGVELIKSPSCLFLDEPTSGLDSFQAQSVMGAMRTLSANGRTVVASIHQPSSSVRVWGGGVCAFSCMH
jgi:ABC-type multidrug transport system ATPase subunit